MTEFGRYIRSLRTEKGMTVEFLAGKVGIQKGYLSGVENGKVPPPSAAVVRALARALGHDRRDLLLRAYVEKLPPEIAPILEDALAERVGG